MRLEMVNDPDRTSHGMPLLNTLVLSPRFTCCQQLTYSLNSTFPELSSGCMKPLVLIVMESSLQDL